MREIKFRGKCSQSKRWVYGNYFIDERDIEDGFIWRDIPQIQQRYGDHYQYYDVDPSTVGQYTGLKDKNGVEIYEGDIIVEIYEGDIIFRQDEVGCVKFSEEDGSFLIRFPHHLARLNATWGLIEIIGNIHDNPELLGGAE